MKINRYSIKKGTTIDEIKAAGGRDGGSFIMKDTKFYIMKSFYYRASDFEFSVGVAFKKDVSDWNDYDNVLVIDEDFCQPYAPFYGENFGKDITDFPTLEYCIEKYNEVMDSLPFLEEKPD